MLYNVCERLMYLEHLRASNMLMWVVNFKKKKKKEFRYPAFPNLMNIKPCFKGTLQKACFRFLYGDSTKDRCTFDWSWVFKYLGNDSKLRIFVRIWHKGVVGNFFFKEDKIETSHNTTLDHLRFVRLDQNIIVPYQKAG